MSLMNAISPVASTVARTARSRKAKTTGNADHPLLTAARKAIATFIARRHAVDQLPANASAKLDNDTHDAARDAEYAAMESIRDLVGTTKEPQMNGWRMEEHDFPGVVFEGSLFVVMSGDKMGDHVPVGWRNDEVCYIQEINLDGIVMGG